MFERLSHRLLVLLKVPHDPAPPAGGPGTLRVFRAGRAYYRLNLAGWIVKQVLALAAFLFWFWALMYWENTERDAASASAPATPPAAAVAAATTPEPTPNAASEAPAGTPAKKGKTRRKNASLKQVLIELHRKTPSLVFPLLWVAKGISLAVYLVQLPITYLILRLDYEQRWYLVTDRSLRLRSGVWSVRELTMSFANLQQITVSQGPLQRFLGIADVCVQSAGGGGAMPGHAGAQHASLHSGVFHAVENAQEIRDLIVERLRIFRETGLGDPEESRHAAPAAPIPAVSGNPRVGADTLGAARELLDEVRRLRAARLSPPVS
jgi:membrane protein YdbS with pleckstrin-like domain